MSENRKRFWVAIAKEKNQISPEKESGQREEVLLMEFVKRKGRKNEEK